MQSTGHTSTHAVSLVPTHGSQMMYATAFSWDRQSRSIARPAPLIAGLVAACVLTCTDLRSAESFEFAPFDSAQGKPDEPWREAPEYLHLFAPAAHRDHYRAYV